MEENKFLKEFVLQLIKTKKSPVKVVKLFPEIDHDVLLIESFLVIRDKMILKEGITVNEMQDLFSAFKYKNREDFFEWAAGKGLAVVDYRKKGVKKQLIKKGMNKVQTKMIETIGELLDKYEEARQWEEPEKREKEVQNIIKFLNFLEREFRAGKIKCSMEMM